MEWAKATRNIKVLRFGAAYIRGVPVYYERNKPVFRCFDEVDLKHVA